MSAVYIDTDPSQAVAPPAPGRTVTDQLLSYINTARAGQGLPAYTMLPGLVASAQLHNQVMAGGCGLSHQCPGELNFAARISAQGVLWTKAAENIAFGGPVPDTLSAVLTQATERIDSMLAETPPNDGHRRNLLSSALRHVGIDVYRDAGGTVWMTQDFTD